MKLQEYEREISKKESSEERISPKKAMKNNSEIVIKLKI